MADRQIPSILSYVDGEEYNGAQAKQQLIRNSKNTVAFFRDFLGSEYVVSRYCCSELNAKSVTASSQ